MVVKPDKMKNFKTVLEGNEVFLDASVCLRCL